MAPTTAAIFIAFAAIVVPRLFAIGGQFRMPGGFDYSLPRDQQAQLSGLPRRAQAAHLNSIEAFAPFAVAVLMAQAANPSALVDQLALGFAATRVLFVACYLSDLNPWRTVVWLIGVALNIALFWQAV